MFADDTCLVYTGEDIDALFDHVNDRLAVIFDWCCYNKLSLNPSKCSYMLFTNRHTVGDNYIKIDGVSLKRSQVIKYLGVHIDEGLKFQHHIDYLCGKLSKLCGVTYRLQELLDLKSAKNVYYSCIYSVITYGICVWGGVLRCTQRGKRLIKLHERSVKNLFCSFFPRSTCIFKQLEILKLIDIYRLNIAIYMFKVTKLNLCPTLQNNLDLLYPSHNYFTRNSDNPLTPYPRVTPIRLSFKYQCVDVWNELPQNIRECSSLRMFKRSLVSRFLNSY